MTAVYPENAILLYEGPRILKVWLDVPHEEGPEFDCYEVEYVAPEKRWYGITGAVVYGQGWTSTLDLSTSQGVADQGDFLRFRLNLRGRHPAEGDQQ